MTANSCAEFAFAIHFARRVETITLPRRRQLGFGAVEPRYGTLVGRTAMKHNLAATAVGKHILAVRSRPDILT